MRRGWVAAESVGIIQTAHTCYLYASSAGTGTEAPSPEGWEEVHPVRRQTHARGRLRQRYATCSNKAQRHGPSGITDSLSGGGIIVGAAGKTGESIRHAL